MQLKHKIPSLVESREVAPLLIFGDSQLSLCFFFWFPTLNWLCFERVCRLGLGVFELLPVFTAVSFVINSSFSTMRFT